jgi:hypothetical protein
VSVICTRTPTADLAGLWASLDSNGYAVTTDESIGLAPRTYANFCQSYFNDDILRHDEGDWPIDRKRARDVIYYDWRNGQPALREFESIMITDRAGIPGRREHSRIELLGDPQAAGVVTAMLRMIPPRRRQETGTFGVNLFRTFTNVVTTPHHDNEEFVIVYVLNRIGDGAESYLYRADDGADDSRPVLIRQLNPGEILVFDDTLFTHGATPLRNPPGGTAMRDALVCTVDYRNTYLAGPPEV